ncbi:MAG: NAD(+)/NADH kinase [Lachnospiraceae bacterium]|nr:NAD(+)/NADH kinase [Lachnospiraceae bacterium]
MKRIFLIYNKGAEDDNLRGAIEKIAKEIEKHGGEAFSAELPMISDEEEVKRVGDLIAQKADGVISVGGDGTLIRTSQLLVERNLPVTGINYGHLGYLCDYDENTVTEIIPRLIADDFEIEERMMLSARLCGRDGKPVTSRMRALNDVVISSTNTQQVLHMEVCVGNQPLYEFTGDGMIFATPTGSTAYNLSANGPLVDPKTRLILMTPLNPHTLSTRGMVLDASDEMSLTIHSRKKDGTETARVSIDGTKSFTLHTDEKLQVRASHVTTRMIKLNNMSFLERIRRKMQRSY